MKYRTELKDAVLRAKASPRALLKGRNICLADHVQPQLSTLSAIVKSAGGNVSSTLMASWLIPLWLCLCLKLRIPSQKPIFVQNVDSWLAWGISPRGVALGLQLFVNFRGLISIYAYICRLLSPKFLTRFEAIKDQLFHEKYIFLYKKCLKFKSVFS